MIDDNHVGHVKDPRSSHSFPVMALALSILDHSYETLGQVVDAEGADFCLDARPSGYLEVWHAPLVGGKHAVAVVNRSPARNQSVTFTAEMIGVGPAASFSVREAWQDVDVPGTSHGSYTVSGLSQRASELLILTPQ